MHKPTWSWKHTLARLGMRIARQERPRRKKLSVEHLEPRQLLASDITIANQANVEGSLTA